MENNSLIYLLESVLGKGQKRAHNQHYFICPNCKEERIRLGKSFKPKLNIQLETNIKGENPYNCFYCTNFKGKTIRSLFKKLEVHQSRFEELDRILKPSNIERIYEKVELPPEFKSLINVQSSFYSKRVLKYLENRGINNEDIIKYNIGYCMNGKYADRIIIPSYDENGYLNFFEARDITNSSSIRYLKPGVNKDDIIAFEFFINWNLPIILVEGCLDAIAVKRNVIPLLGKTISSKLMKKIVTSQVSKIYLALDSDAQKSTLKYAKELMDKGKEVYIVDLNKKDPSSLGFIEFTKLIQHTYPLTFDDLFIKKLELI